MAAGKGHKLEKTKIQQVQQLLGNMSNQGNMGCPWPCIPKMSLLAIQGRGVWEWDTEGREWDTEGREKEPKVQERIIWMEVLRSEGQEGQSLGLQGMSGKLCWR